MTDAIAHQRCGRLELKVKELEDRIKKLEEQLEAASVAAANAYRMAESADMWHRPIGGS